MQKIRVEETQAVKNLMRAEFEKNEQAILKRIGYLKQHCSCFLFCTGKKFEFILFPI